LGQLLGHALLNNGISNLLTSLQIGLIQAQLCTWPRIVLQDSFPHGAKNETCEGCHLACDPFLLCIQWFCEQLREHAFIFHFRYHLSCIKEGSLIEVVPDQIEQLNVILES